MHIGSRVPGDPMAQAMALDSAVPLAGLNGLAPRTILPEASRGFPARPGIEGHRSDGSGWAPRMEMVDIATTPDSVTMSSADDGAGLSQQVSIALDASGVVKIWVTVTNTAASPYQLDGLTMCVPLPSSAREAMQLGGRWSNEFRAERRLVATGALEVENRAGRTSHDRFPALFVGDVGFSEERGEVLAAHLAWSGNSRLRVESFSDGRRVLQVGDALLPGEMQLAPGETYTSPVLYLAWSNAGLNGISDCFHPYVRGRASHPTTDRPVLLNTWEAVYFDHDLDRLKALADTAAQVGAERFVLDDGWFRHRRDDTAGLGDWYVDETVWPDGLDPIIDHVTGLGMEFGLWFEPEMVNPNSDLYRAHPEWALVPAEQIPVEARNQLVLDLSNPEVFAYLLERINAILGAYEISYVKWDMNRNLVAATHNSRATVHHQTRAVYELFAQVRAANPGVEIESCSSGGGRADLAILEHSDRIWTSDCNDALDRQRIQRGFSYLLPPELMGAHIGPPTAHTTGRTHTLGFRATTAFFGHLGIEWNVLSASENDRERLARVIELHKRHRGLLHSGRVVRYDHADPAATAHAVIAHDQSEALVSFAQIATSDSLATGALRVGGLAADQVYSVRLVDIEAGRPWGKAFRQPKWVDTDLQLTGAQLAAGLQMPILDPESAIVLHVVAAEMVR
ncbi:UNVERIFIED_CONTAM: hypothetical protein GTU68_000747 [Idotea baltica]|nr:hypothetical protein [Idotea baltica]